MSRGTGRRPVLPKSAKRLLLFAATTGYQIRVFADAACRLGIDLTLATDRCHILEDPWGDRAIPVRFDRVAESVDALRGIACDGIVAVGDRPAVLAAEAAVALGVPFHPPAAARACANKFLARQLYQAAGLRVPAFFQAPFAEGAAAAARRASFPCVLKPVGLSASRGVIRADTASEFAAAFERIRAMLDKSEPYLQVEAYIEGREFALEGLVTDGHLQPLAIFDKPDPLEGPFFEETIYVTPSRQAAAVQQELIETVAAAVRALGLRHGPVHAELRYNRDGAWMLETAARPIGGLCAKALRFEWCEKGADESVPRRRSCAAWTDPSVPGFAPLEELILRHALGEDVSAAHREPLASAVMMIPIPKGGIYHSADGLDQAALVPGVGDVIITAKEGQHLVPLPEGASYLGFIFARAATPEEVEAALRRSHAALRFHIATVLDTFKPSS